MSDILKKRKQYLSDLLGNNYNQAQQKFSQEHFAASNIALIKYWGKECSTLFIPANSSLSLSLGDLGAKTSLEVLPNEVEDKIFLNDKQQKNNSRFSKPIIEFLDLFRSSENRSYCVRTKMNIPHSSGLASSACGFAALTCALNELHAWNKTSSQLSLVARIGSGSACRSLFQGFVHWKKGSICDPFSSHAQRLKCHWPEICFALHPSMKTSVKKISSRQAMKDCARTSPFYEKWPNLSESHVSLALGYL